MEQNSKKDYLNYKNNKSIKQIIGNDNIILSIKVLELDKYNLPKEINLIVTNTSLYTIKKKTLVRKLLLSQIAGIIITQDSDEFGIICNGNEKDCDYMSINRSEIITVIDEAFRRYTKRKLNFSQITEKSLRQYINFQKENTENSDLENEEQEEDENNTDNQDLNNIKNLRNSNNHDPLIYRKLSENSNNQNSLENLDLKKITPKDFQKIKIIDKSNNLYIQYLVKYLPSQEIFVLKEYSKIQLLKEKQMSNITYQKQILDTIDNPFLTKLILFFQTNTSMNFITTCVSGGRIGKYLTESHPFPENRVKFYGAQIALAIQYLHDKKIIYRDLKLDNIYIDELGYLKIDNFELAIKDSGININKSLCGTAEYLAPEMILGKGYDKNVDWWQFGIVLYEMLCGTTPFYDDNIDVVLDNIVKGDVIFPSINNLSNEAKDLIKKLLCNNVKERLGYKEGINEIKEHPFFRVLDFKNVEQKKLTAPFYPETALGDEEDIDSEESGEEGENDYSNEEDDRVKMEEEESEENEENEDLEESEEKPEYNSKKRHK